MSRKHVFPIFTACMVLYYFSYASIIGFATLYLQRNGFTNTEIGIFYALSSAICASAAAVILYFAAAQWLIFTCYVIVNMLMLLNSSLFNAFGMEYINARLPLNYSLSRGGGSVFYALSAFLMGHIISRFPITSTVFIIFQCLLLAGLHFLQTNVGSSGSTSASYASKDKTTSGTPASDGFFHFLRRNPRLSLLFASILLIYISYTSVMK